MCEPALGGVVEDGASMEEGDTVLWECKEVLGVDDNDGEEEEGEEEGEQH